MWKRGDTIPPDKRGDTVAYLSLTGTELALFSAHSSAKEMQKMVYVQVLGERMNFIDDSKVKK